VTLKIRKVIACRMSITNYQSTLTVIEAVKSSDHTVRINKFSI